MLELVDIDFHLILTSFNRPKIIRNHSSQVSYLQPPITLTLYNYMSLLTCERDVDNDILFTETGTVETPFFTCALSETHAFEYNRKIMFYRLNILFGFWLTNWFVCRQVLSFALKISSQCCKQRRFLCVPKDFTRSVVVSSKGRC